MRGWQLTTLTAACLWLSVDSAAALDAYLRRDFQYFRPMLANLREPHNHMRVYGGDSPEFARKDGVGLLGYWDVGFGERFYMAGIGDTTTTRRGPLRLSGYALFIDGSGHMLLDFDSESNAVINTDFRVGAGIAWRSYIQPAVAVRLRWFHESTHLGDEYILQANGHERADEFRRYNVSYEVQPWPEVYISLDEPVPTGQGSWPAYRRIYGGWRRVSRDAHEGFDRAFNPTEPLLTKRNEYHIGGELFFRGWPADLVVQSPLDILKYSYLVCAVDLHRQSRYDTVAPEGMWAVNAVVGIVYGEELAHQTLHTVRYQLNYYRGRNPHGEFRREKVTYVGLDMVLDF